MVPQYSIDKQPFVQTGNEPSTHHIIYARCQALLLPTIHALSHSFICHLDGLLEFGAIATMDQRVEHLKQWRLAPNGLKRNRAFGKVERWKRQRSIWNYLIESKEWFYGNGWRDEENMPRGFIATILQKNSSRDSHLLVDVQTIFAEAGR